MPPSASGAHLLGRDIAMIFQDPMTQPRTRASRSRFQLIESAARCTKAARARGAARARALELLREVEIPDAERRLDAYPHQLSGGMASA